METKQLLDDYQKRELALIHDHIMQDCAPGDCDWHCKGIIVSDDPTGELFTEVREALNYDVLVAAGKVNKISVGSSYPLKSLRECWNVLKTEAQKVPDGLLHIWVNDIKLFEYCWCLKQLAKQESKELKFKGYVLLVIKFDKWEDVKKYATEHNKGEFDAMMGDFYQRIETKKEVND